VSRRRLSEPTTSEPSGWLRTLARAPAERPRLHPGTPLGRYTIESLLGAGASGTVYVAWDGTLRRRVALKIFRGSFVDAPDERARWLREARIAASLTAREIVAIYDIGEHDGQVFIAMELVDGPSLRDELRRGPLPLARALAVAHDVASALMRAHEAHVIHRDLKPENLRLDQQDRVRVLDFGLAISVEADASVRGEAREGEGIGAGTRGYMAPEQVRGERASPQSDVFSLGVVLYEMLTGFLPFETGSADAYLEAVEHARYERPSSRNRAVPPEVDALVARCLAFDARKRFSSAGELREALARLRAATGPARRWWRTAIASASLLAAVAVAVVVARSRGAPVEQHRGSSPAAASSRQGASLLDRPPVAAHSPEARAAYDDAVRLLRGASVALASKGFLRAIALDPELAAARLRITTYSMVTDPLTIRQHLAKAHENQQSLSPEDVTALGIFESSVGAETDTATPARLWTAAAARFPDDAESQLELAYALDVDGQAEAAEAAYEHALSLDPGFALALLTRGIGRAKRGDYDGARADLSECVVRSPAALSCMRRLAAIHEQQGDCDAFAADAQRMTAVGPQDPQSYLFLSRALATTGASVDGIRLARHKAAELFGEPWTSTYHGQADTLLALWSGDLVEAERHARQLASAVREHVNEYDHEFPTTMLLRVLEETGRADEGARIAKEYVDLVPAWTGHEWISRSLVLRAVHHSPRLSQAAYETLRRDWSRDLAASLSAGRPAALSWIAYQATPARDGHDAEEALALLPSIGPLPAMAPTYPRPTSLDEPIGRVYLLADRPAEAVPYLRRAARFCSRLEDPVQWMQAQVELGRALERNGDIPGACDAYRAVARAWPATRPPSVTATAASRATQTLGCTR
jgi:serine/threonine-protein kinase